MSDASAREDASPPDGTEPDASSQLSEGELVDVVDKFGEAVRDFSNDVDEIRAIFSGPIPPPDLLQAYEDAVPGLADRLVAMAEKEGDHRRALEMHSLEHEAHNNETVVKHYADEVKRGQHYGLVIGVTAILAGSLVALTGAEIAGSFIGCGGVVGLVATFIHGRRNPFTAGNEAPEQNKADD